MTSEPSATRVPEQGNDEEHGAASAGQPPPEEQSLKERVYDLTENPDSSTAAKIVAAFVLLCIIGSTACFILETVPALESYRSFWFYAEIFFVSVFTVEYIARLWSTPLPKWRFMIEPFNVIDLLAIAPFYIEMVMPGGSLDLRVLRALRLLRLFRLFKVGKYSSNTKLVQLALSRSVEALVLMIFFLGMVMIFFATIMYLVERGEWNDEMGCIVRPAAPDVCSPFVSIPHSFYWAITTMTTVGYGDVLPTTNLGKLVAGCTMIVGIVVIALPVTMIGNTFVDAHMEIKEEQRLANAEEESKNHHENLQELFGCTQEWQKLKNESDVLLSEMKQLLAGGMIKIGKHDTAGSALAELNPAYDLLHSAFVQSMEDLNSFMKISLPEVYR